jgi:hypothetical protein
MDTVAHIGQVLPGSRNEHLNPMTRQEIILVGQSLRNPVSHM